MGKDGQIIKQILELARLAPSSHNTQPWKAAIKEGKVVVGYEPERQLTVGDPERREMFISLGCFIETAGQAAASLGYEMTCQYIGDHPEGVARLSFAKKSSASPKPAEAIRRRRSDRRPYMDQLLAPADLESLSRLSRASAKLVLLTSKEQISFISEMTKQATLSAMKRNEFRAELASWVRNNWTRRPDGMPAYVQGIPGPVSLIAKTVIRNNPKVANDQAKKDSKSINHSSALALITLKNENPQAWLDAGRLFQALCLQATQKGISSAAYSAAVMDEETSAMIIKELGLKSQPVALLRLGYANGHRKASPRRKLEDILS